MIIPNSNGLNHIQEEALGILQEEAAELIQELSKVRRSGIRFCRKKGSLDNNHFVGLELMDFLILLELCVKAGVIIPPSDKEFELHKEGKFERLRKWSKLGPLIDDI